MINKKYIIFCPYVSGIGGYYICDGEFIFQGEKYRVTTETELLAKRYTTHNRAKAAAESMLNKCVNLSSDYQILEVEE